MKYSIHYSYRTGDSFGHRDKESVLELTWKDKEAAKAALVAIKEHYLYYKSVNKEYFRSTDEAIEAKRIEVDAPTKPWFASGDDYDNQYCLILKTDEGKDFRLWAPWCGYFETLHSAKIVAEL